VYNGDYPTIEGLIDDRKVLDRPLKPSSGCVLVYLGLSKQDSDQLTHQFFILRDFRHYMERVLSKQMLPTDPSLYVFKPTAVEDTSSQESTLYMLIPVPTAIDPMGEELRTFVDE
jgi:phytoene desaturase